MEIYSELRWEEAKTATRAQAAAALRSRGCDDCVHWQSHLRNLRRSVAHECGPRSRRTFRSGCSRSRSLSLAVRTVSSSGPAQSSRTHLNERWWDDTVAVERSLALPQVG